MREAIIIAGLILLGWILLRLRRRKQPTRQATEQPRETTAPRAPVAKRREDTEPRGHQEPASAAKSSERYWLPPGQSVDIRGFSISGGMIYVGSGLPAIAGHQGSEPALIDPKLPVSRSQIGSIPELGYWPSYANLDPTQRAGYLSWLAAGRHDPAVQLGFVFLFFYGLERRVYVESTHTDAVTHEAPALVTEIERLLAIYGEHRSFRRYANQLLTFVRVGILKQRMSERPVPQVLDSYELPLELRFALGEFVLDERPIPSDWALAWLLADPTTRLRTPATRCEPEFRALFAERYRERFGDGLRLKANKTLLEIRLTPASASFGGQFTLSSTRLPDVAVLSRPVAQFREVAERCMDELDGLSRYLGRNPNGRETPQVLAHLPAALAEVLSGKAGNEMREWVEHVLSGGGIAQASEAMERWGCANAARMSKREAVELAQALERIGIGIEPDVRFLGSVSSRDDKILLFRLPDAYPTAPSKEYGAAALLLHLAAAVSASDGIVSEAEAQRLREHLEQGLRLSAPESARLAAHLRWLLAEPPGLSALKKRIETVSPEGRLGIAQFSILVAGIDGRIDPGEVKVLQKIYSMLGLEADRVYSDLHELVSDSSVEPAREPVTVRPRGSPGREFSIPPKQEEVVTSQREGAVTLDMARVRQTMKQTTEVSALLATIFSKNDGNGDGVTVTPPEPEAALITGLDSVHSAFLRELARKPIWSREEFDALTGTYGLFSDGAIEMLNEAAFERYGAPLIEEDQGITIDEKALGVMLA